MLHSPMVTCDTLARKKKKKKALTQLLVCHGHGKVTYVLEDYSKLFFIVDCIKELSHKYNY